MLLGNVLVLWVSPPCGRRAASWCILGRDIWAIPRTITQPPLSYVGATPVGGLLATRWEVAGASGEGELRMRWVISLAPAGHMRLSTGGYRNAVTPLESAVPWPGGVQSAAVVFVAAAVQPLKFSRALFISGVSPRVVAPLVGSFPHSWGHAGGSRVPMPVCLGRGTSVSKHHKHDRRGGWDRASHPSMPCTRARTSPHPAGIWSPPRLAMQAVDVGKGVGRRQLTPCSSNTMVGCKIAEVVRGQTYQFGFCSFAEAYSGCFMLHLLRGAQHKGRRGPVVA